MRIRCIKDGGVDRPTTSVEWVLYSSAGVRYDDEIDSCTMSTSRFCQVSMSGRSNYIEQPGSCSAGCRVDV